MSRVLVLVLIAVGAVACGGGGDHPAAAPDTASASAPARQSAESSSGSKIDAAADLSEFVCEPDGDGEWDASGVITNSSDQTADYRVTVVVSDGSGASLTGKRRTLPELTPEAPEPFDIKRLPSVDDTDATCQVEVIRFR